MKIQRLIIDTNLLVLYVVGTASREYITRHKKLTSYTPQDYDTLLQVLGLTDAVALESLTANSTLLTADLELHVAALQNGMNSINFNHIRDQYL